MQTKTISILLGVLILLIGAWYGWNYLQKQQANQMSGWITFSSDANANFVDKIVVDGSLSLLKTNNLWQADGTLVKTDLVNGLLSVIQNPKVELVSQNQDRYTELGVADEEAQTLSFWQGETEKLVLLISKINNSIIRVKGMQNVYKLGERLNLNTSASYWWAPPEPSPTQGEDEKQK